MPGTDPCMPAVRACRCGAVLLGGLAACLEHADRDDLAHEIVALHGQLAAAREETRVAETERDVAMLALRDTQALLEQQPATVRTGRAHDAPAESGARARVES